MANQTKPCGRSKDFTTIIIQFLPLGPRRYITSTVACKANITENKDHGARVLQNVSSSDMRNSFATV